METKMTRAMISLGILSAVAVATVAAAYLIVGQTFWDNGFAVGAAVAFVLAEFFIVCGTIGPAAVRWIVGADGA